VDSFSVIMHDVLGDQVAQVSLAKGNHPCKAITDTAGTASGLWFELGRRHAGACPTRTEISLSLLTGEGPT
jgi:hypothetical protein